MGIIPTPDYDEGDLCSRCFGPGKTFGDVPTPARVQAVFTGIVSCPLATPLKNGAYVLTQSEDYPCCYSDDNAIFWFSKLKGGAYLATISLNSSLPYEFQFLGEAPEGTLDFTNLIKFTDCPIIQYRCYGGTCEISWGPEI